VHGEARSVGIPCGLFNACMGRTDGRIGGWMDDIRVGGSYGEKKREEKLH
jgi:hypothetical protein